MLRTRLPLALWGLLLSGGCAMPATSGTEAGPSPRPLGDLSTPSCDPASEGEWSSRSPGGTPEVDVATLEAQKCRLRVIDVRERDELTGPLGVIEGAEHIPAREVMLESTRWDPDRPVVLVCRSGRRSGRLAVELQERGFTQVASLAGGMLAWNAAGRPVASGEPLSRTSSAPAEPTVMRTVTRDDVSRHIADHQRVRWTKAASLMLQGTQACVDGRDAHAIVGTPGGDAGELVLALATAEQLGAPPLSEAEVGALFDAYLDAFGHFYLHSDDDAVAALLDDLAEQLPDQGIPEATDRDAALALLREPSPELREALRERVVDPRFVGCGHLRLMLEQPERYGVRRALVEAVIRSYFDRLWSGHPALELVVLHGSHHESAVVEVELEATVHPYTRIPLVSPRLADTEVFVRHAPVARFVRRENAAFLLERAPRLRLTGVDEVTFFDHLEALAGRQAEATFSRLAQGLPVYTVRFDDDGFSVEGPSSDSTPPRIQDSND